MTIWAKYGVASKSGTAVERRVACTYADVYSQFDKLTIWLSIVGDPKYADFSHDTVTVPLPTATRRSNHDSENRHDCRPLLRLSSRRYTRNGTPEHTCGVGVGSKRDEPGQGIKAISGDMDAPWLYVCTQQPLSRPTAMSVGCVWSASHGGQHPLQP